MVRIRWFKACKRWGTNKSWKGYEVESLGRSTHFDHKIQSRGLFHILFSTFSKSTTFSLSSKVSSLVTLGAPESWLFNRWSSEFVWFLSGENASHHGRPWVLLTNCTFHSKFMPNMYTKAFGLSAPIATSLIGGGPATMIWGCVILPH